MTFIFLSFGCACGKEEAKYYLAFVLFISPYLLFWHEDYEKFLILLPASFFAYFVMLKIANNLLHFEYNDSLKRYHERAEEQAEFREVKFLLLNAPCFFIET